jgi:hypothetical protein
MYKIDHILNETGINSADFTLQRRNAPEYLAQK